MPLPKGLAARAVIETGRCESKLYIEVREGNKFSNFYHIYTATGRGRGRIVTPAIPRHRGFADTIEDAAEKIAKVMKDHAKRNRREIQIHTTIRIYRKRLYRRLLSMRPDELGLTRVSNGLAEYLRRQKSTPVLPSIPLGHTPMDKRWKILTG
jgi:hypothetical protein